VLTGTARVSPSHDSIPAWWRTRQSRERWSWSGRLPPSSSFGLWASIILCLARSKMWPETHRKPLGVTRIGP